MQNETLNQEDYQPLDEAKLVQIDGGYTGIDFPVHTLPIRFPRPPIIFPIIDPIIFPIELPLSK